MPTQLGDTLWVSTTMTNPTSRINPSKGLRESWPSYSHDTPAFTFANQGFTIATMSHNSYSLLWADREQYFVEDSIYSKPGLYKTWWSHDYHGINLTLASLRLCL